MQSQHSIRWLVAHHRRRSRAFARLPPYPWRTDTRAEHLTARGLGAALTQNWGQPSEVCTCDVRSPARDFRNHRVPGVYLHYPRPLPGPTATTLEFAVLACVNP